MTDFLGRLAARTRNGAPVVRPAIAPLFRPAAPVWTDVAVDDDAVADGDALVPPPRRTTEVNSPSPADGTIARPRAVQAVDPSVRITSGQGRSDMHAEADHVPAHRALVADRARPLEWLVVPTPSRDPDPGAPPSARELVPEPVARTLRPTPPAATPGSPLRVRVVAEAAPPRPSPSPRPPAARALEELRTLDDAGRAARERPATSTSEVVRITIGRVEVRMVQPAAPGPARPRASSRAEVSLADYLAKQRNPRT